MDLLKLSSNTLDLKEEKIKWEKIHHEVNESIDDLGWDIDKLSDSIEEEKELLSSYEAQIKYYHEKIKIIQQSIQENEEQLLKLQTELSGKEQEFEKIEEMYDEYSVLYKKSITDDYLSLVNEVNEENSYHRRLWKDTKTVSLLDSYLKSGKHFLLLEFPEYFLLNRQHIYCTLIITRYYYGVDYESSQPTMTNLKQMNDDSRLKPLLEEIRYILNSHDKIQKGDVYSFRRPYAIGGQTSANRTDYGSIYYWGELQHQGTLYGEVTNFLSIGIRIEDIW